MAPSSTSLPASPLPFGADTHTHSAWRRSLSISRTPHPNAEAVRQLYKDADPKAIQDYPSFVAAARASDLALRRTSASIPPSSINDLPHRIRKVLKRHTVQLWVLAGVFQINMILLTIAITLGVVTAHSHGDGNTKAAALILGLIGLLGAVSSVAFGWLTWQGREARARLEKQWIAEEEVKEKRNLNEKATSETVLKGIRDRERSLSATRGRSRGSSREQKIPSFKELTPPETERESPVVDALPRARKDVKEDGVHTSTNGVRRDSSWTHHLDLDEEEDEYVPPVPPVPPVLPVELPTSNSSPERDPNGHGIDGPPALESPNRGVSPDIQQLEQQLRTRLNRPASPQLGESSTTITRNSLSPTLNGSSPINEEIAVPLINSLLAHRRAMSTGNLPLTPSHRSQTPTTLLPSSPLNPNFQNPPTPIDSTRINSLLANRRRSLSNSHTPAATTPTRSPPPSPSHPFPRAGNAALGSEQSDNNFLANLDDDKDENEDARSEDEALRILRTERSREQVGRWAAGLDLPFGMYLLEF
ncbi:hypothetical protein JMJ35_009137 [Cladonia borealis]|uniref:SMODS and SLOG-associating 2TM effector domain-containing protein n=1 Tax=Cladonia borealis TaxID=184061 RepID=A0AA39QUV9_9LECA|nr:hypothetical protein JMJ35_009137 [Cladonia borealis]